MPAPGSLERTMDGDLKRPRPTPAPEHGEAWSYSTRLPTDPGHPLTALPQADATPQRHAPQRDREEASDKKDPASKDESSDKTDAEPKKPKPGWKKALYWFIGLAVLAVLIVAGVLYWLHARHFENTDDAFIDGHMSQVSAQVGAKVLTLAFQDNQRVRAGDPLLQLDPRDYQIKLDQAVAQRAQAAAQVSQAKAGLLMQQANADQAEAQVRVSQADLGQAAADLARYRAIDPKAITRQQLDNSSAQTKSAQARVDANRQAVEGARAQIESQKAQIEAAVANLRVADVAVDNAKLQLSYTVVTAPTDGRVTKRTVEVGNYVSPGQSLFALVPPDLWVTANFKETQLADMRKDQAVRVRVDACPDLDIPAHVESFQSGTGAVFSSLPSENATGNYVKVVQRVPVKIVFDKPSPETCNLAPGLSVSPRVTVRP